MISSDEWHYAAVVITEAWLLMDDAQRLTILRYLRCCRGCGSLDTGCRCEDDE